ncbi:MAG: hypothetical protein Phog2KO_33670 [Phototrophicaceae bacterium]
MIQEQKIYVKNYKQFRAINMVWSNRVNKQEIKQAFLDINAQLDMLTEPICVVVDLRENTFMPLAETFKGALTGPHKHHNLAGWLIIGENTFARYVAGMLDKFGGDKEIQWFSSEDGVDEYLEEHCSYV